MGTGLENKEKRRIEMLDNCYFCKAKVVQQEVTIDYRWRDDLVVIKDVPAGVCQQCGEKYLTGNVYKELERVAREKSHRMDTVKVDVLYFETDIAA